MLPVIPYTSGDVVDNDFMTAEERNLHLEQVRIYTSSVLPFPDTLSARRCGRRDLEPFRL